MAEPRTRGVRLSAGLGRTERGLWWRGYLDNWGKNHAAISDKCHEQTEYSAHDDGHNFVVLDVHPDESEALDRQKRGGKDGLLWEPPKGGWNDEADGAYKFQYPQRSPGSPRKRAK